jgi:RNA polymerase sigma factor (sigma-70 family)
MRDDPAVVDLVVRARAGDQVAWDAIVDRYAPLVWSVCRRRGIYGSDADDVGANTWLRLVEHLGTLREPAALPGWLAITTDRECLQWLRRSGRVQPTDDEDQLADGRAGDPGLDAALEQEERRIALRDALAQLSDRCRQLLGLLFSDPPVAYVEVAPALGVAVGAIGAMRQRCLDHLRRSPSLLALSREMSR